jgi:DNA (cytosine-5)-methyltransferase 1
MPQPNHQQLSKEFQPSFYLKKTSATKNSEITFIDLFAGIGGFHAALKNLKAKCVFAAEIDKEARKTYELNHYKNSAEMFDLKNFAHDITKINPHEIPDFDLLCAGFPCQPFSQAGFKKGFEEARGTLFFNIVNIIKTKKPQAFFLENVRHLLNHQNGETFATIKKILEQDLGYKFYHKIVKASDFNLPQHRARLFMVGFKNQNIDFQFPKPLPLTTTMSDIWGESCAKKIGYTLRVGGRGSKIDDRRNWDSYLVGKNIKRISVKEGKKMMGFDEDFIFPVSETQAMKQLGNSVAVPAIQATAQKIIEALRNERN